MKKKILTIIGARPQFIKAAAVSRAFAAWNNAHPDHYMQEVILHTGQHYDENMSDVFFRQMGIPVPDINLHVGSASHAEQTARMLTGIEQVLRETHYDGVIIYGDTNSTLAGALAAAKLCIPVFHVEAGLRSGNMQMPEEINRIVADDLSSLLFTPTDAASANLRNIGRKKDIRQVGDVMYDNAIFFADMAEKQSNILRRLNMIDGGFVLATIHRQANTDDPERLANIFSALEQIAKETTVVLPLHPRTKAAISTLNSPLSTLHCIDPVPFFDMIALERHATLILTDSGGVQKEAFFYGKPAIILRAETEWTEIVDAGAAVLADADTERICAAFRSLSTLPPRPSMLTYQPYGDGHAAEKIIEQIASFYR